jgi:hypothetical protein
MGLESEIKAFVHDLQTFDNTDDVVPTGIRRGRQFFDLSRTFTEPQAL